MEYSLGAIANHSAVLAEAATLSEFIRVMRVNHLSSPNSTTEQLHWGSALHLSTSL